MAVYGPDNPQNLEHLREAARFMEEARRIQSASGKKFKGGVNLDDDVIQSVIDASNNSSLVRTLRKGETVTERGSSYLFERFEEMCRRRNVRVPNDLRPDIVKLLALELAANRTALDLEENIAASVTVYHGNVASLPDEFPEFADTPYMFKFAVDSTPSDPRGLLRRVSREMTAMRGESEFAVFADTPWIFRHAAMNNPVAPRELLRKVISEMKAMMNEAKQEGNEFAEFADTPGIFKHAAVHNPSDPRGLLRNLIREVAEMQIEPEFADFADMPGIFIKAAKNYPSNPRGFLRGVIKEVAAMETESEFACLAKTPYIYKYVAASNPSDPRGFLRKVIKDVAVMKMKPEFAEFADVSWVFQDAALHNPSDPCGFLLKLKDEIVTLQGSPAFHNLARWQQIKYAIKKMGMEEDLPVTERLASSSGNALSI